MERRFTVFGDLNCPFCFTLHEWLLDLGYLDRVVWRDVEHIPQARFDVSDLQAQAELSKEVNRVRQVAPELNIVIPPARPNSRVPIQHVTQAYSVDRAKAIKFRTLIYRALWIEGRDFSEPSLLESLRKEAGLPPLSVARETLQKIAKSQDEWEHGSASQYIPALITPSGSRYLGLPSMEVTRAFFKDEDSLEFEEGAFCFVKPREKILIAVEEEDLFAGHAKALQMDYQVEFVRDGYSVFASCLSESAPDLVIMDVNLPPPNGFETCLKIKDHERSQTVPVMLFTDEADPITEVRAFDAGASDFVVCPCAKEVLKARARVLLRLKRTTDLLEQFSRLDALTEIPNRREFDRILEREWLRATRTRKPLSVILCDIDYFKRYNDNYGHMEGDQCLRRVAQLIESGTRRPPDIVARYGGEEFVIILPETDQAGAVKVARKIHAKLAEVAIPHEYADGHKRITVSQGVATALPNASLQPKALINSADQALYRAKENGRNRFECGAKLVANS